MWLNLCLGQVEAKYVKAHHLTTKLDQNMTFKAKCKTTSNKDYYKK